MSNDNRELPTDRAGWKLACRLCILATSTFVLGCMTLGPMRNTGGPAAEMTLQQQPNPQDVVAFLNASSARIQSIEAQDLDMDIKAGTGIGPQAGVSGDLFCQKPRNFRLRAKVIGKEVADIGSNSELFWSFNAEERPPALYYCSYDALTRGNVPLPFPVQPEWVLEVLGMATLNPSGNFSVAPVDVKRPVATIDLIERTSGLGGQPVTKVTTCNIAKSNGTRPQVVSHRLYDGQNRLVCEARVLSVRPAPLADNPGSTVAVVHDVELRIPGQQPNQTLTIKLKLGGVRVNAIDADAARNPTLYQLPKKQGVQLHDLARGLPAAPASLQRTGNWGR